ncbi:alanine racemase [Leeia sp. TBRC 13508]|uniref:Alanine racemase n=1 Tax=Leeia speluncae TaxID=2884804 RepID=A0ABS8D764_9NEIS|nr:alanine racemase [Leeia speluncae]MCB6184011.1 alanine racemase [Leeia speluncae]
MHSTTRVQLDLAALRHNYNQIKQIADSSKAYAVVKSDAYGHGLLRIAKGLHDADGFALIQMDDLRALRESGIWKPVLLLEGVMDASDLLDAAILKAEVVLRSEAQLQMIEKTSVALKQPLAIWLKVNTGMNRFGFPPAQIEEVMQRLASNSSVKLKGVMTHFACADDLDCEIEGQWRVFHEVVRRYQLPFTAANSAAILRDQRTHGEVVRAGSLIYGNNPFSQAMPVGYDFRPVMSLRSEIIGLSNLQKGDALGYGASFVADRPMLIGLVGCGYGDGYPYTAPTGTPVLVKGNLTRVVGKVAMNVMAVDLTEVGRVGLGDPVVLWGDHQLPISEVSKYSGVLSEALECGLTKRLPVCLIGEESIFA